MRACNVKVSLHSCTSVDYFFIGLPSRSLKEKWVLQKSKAGIRIVKLSVKYYVEDFSPFTLN